MLRSVLYYVGFVAFNYYTQHFMQFYSIYVEFHPPLGLDSSYLIMNFVYIRLTLICHCQLIREFILEILVVFIPPQHLRIHATDT